MRSIILYASFLKQDIVPDAKDQLKYYEAWASGYVQLLRLLILSDAYNPTFASNFAATLAILIQKKFAI